MDSDTPSIAFLEPSNLKGFQPGRSRDAQPVSIPRPFLDAMEVRGKVFVREQNVPLENEFDSDDSRSCHWVVYATSKQTAPPAGTVRLVPFPHEPHPEAGGSYWNGVLEGEQPVTGSEPYVKLGRLAVIKECRGQRLAGYLVIEALSWLKANKSYFDDAVTEPGSEQGAPRWKGLVCAHAQEQAVGAWAKWGFQVDEGMGRWFEEGIPHVGMFRRLDIE
ncbi:acetyltransferase [Hirsutella rhossiliensis]|uniref:Acetyltransferase (GNAT) domain-containing protein n=1 Tax=Hirsutella rhossiliensis TaxID=111463 RepID=A0A9P8MT72_9HYPO|nr:acetyltransferase (GNAT) domain-containing protein [Hirsutella rhossiliensis]KAH0960850.1 acetyltransferase (GNAT) domain-containing protein [Hirsutella rhossiliensis]